MTRIQVHEEFYAQKSDIGLLLGMLSIVVGVLTLISFAVPITLDDSQTSIQTSPIMTNQE